jgi:Polyketide cyclase / dehydrase and lipid transport
LTVDQNAELSIPRASSTAPRLKSQARDWLGLVGWLFPRNAVTDVVATSAHFNESPEAVWQRILLYEEVPVPPPFLLRVLLPHPVRTEGDKTRVGAAVQCRYYGGNLVKRITVVAPPRLIQFEVTEQRLGIEGCITVLGGSYEIRPVGDGTEIVLITNYRGHLRPRSLWRPLEGFLARQLHRHILAGMRAAVSRS